MAYRIYKVRFSSFRRHPESENTYDDVTSVASGVIRCAVAEQPLSILATDAVFCISRSP